MTAGKGEGMRYSTILLAAGGLAAAALSTEARAQQAADVTGPVAQTTTARTATVKSGAGPVVYLVDKSGKLGTLNLGTHAVHVIGSTRLHLTDIAFTPDHKLYGVTFKNFYRVDPATGHATFVGKLGPNGINALVFDKSGHGYAAAFNSTNLYRIDAATGHATVIGPNGKYASAGDLTFFKGLLLLTTSDENVVALNPATGKAGAVRHDGIKDLFGLVSPSSNEIDAFAFDKAYRYNTSLQQITSFSFAGKGLGKILGAAFDGNFGP